jgi:hypothetical protein
MKKDIAKTLNGIAEKLPIVFKAEPIDVEMYGWELNLTPLGNVRKFEPNTVYKYPFFQLRAVEHKQQLKDAFKNNGLTGVKTYLNSVTQSL